MQPFVCLICGTTSPDAGDCRHCDLPFLDGRLPETREAVEKANEARRHKHDQRLLFVAVAGAMFVLVLIGMASLAILGFVLPAPQLIAFGLLLAFGGWRVLVRVFPAHAVELPPVDAPAGPGGAPR